MRDDLERRLSADLGDLRFHGGRGARLLCRILRAGAVTFGHRIFVSAPAARRLGSGGRKALALAAHEAVHVLQYRREGLLPFLARYVYEYCRARLRGRPHDRAYRNISYEREAFAIEARVLQSPAPDRGVSPAATGFLPYTARMPDLSGKQRKWLRAQAHSLKPYVQLGAKGLTDAVVAEVDSALDAHELIKVRLAGERDEREAQAADLADRVEAEAVGITGKIAILYRPHPEPDKRRVQPPKA